MFEAQKVLPYPLGLRKAPRKLMASPRVVGHQSPGNASSSYLGRQWTPGLLAPLSGRPSPSCGGPDPLPSSRRICPGCGIEAPKQLRCNYCW